jgi:hypothetical protein
VSLTATQKTVTRIGTDNVERFLEVDRPLFIAVLRKDPDLLENLRLIMEVTVEFKDEVLAACYTLEDLLPYFAERFGVGGTPTYLMVRNGEFEGSLLGKNSRKNLEAFIQEHLGKRPGGEHAGEKHPRADATLSVGKRASRGRR